MKKVCLKFLYMLLGLIVVAACAKDEEVFTGNILGKVTDAVTGEVLQGVTVTITPTGASRTTGSDGYFEFRDLEPKQYEIQARKSGYSTNNKTATVVTGRDVSGDIQLTPIKQDGKLELSVSSLNFGSQNSSLSFSIQNNGNKTFNWNISGLDDINWFKVNPTTGTLAAGKSNAVTVTLNRDFIIENKEAIIIVNADNESLPLKITAEVESKTSKIALSTSSLNFGTSYTSLGFDVKNIGTAGDVNWNISGVDVDWIMVSPMEGMTAMGKSSAVNVTVDRSKLTEGQHTTTILVNADGESLRVTINAEKGSERYLEVTPSALVLGTNESATLAIMSHNGPTVYELYGDGDFSWATFDKVEGVIPEYNSTDATTIETITLMADRTGLTAGDYSFTLIIRSDLGDYTVPVTMTVEEGQSGSVGNAEIISCHDDLVFTLTSCKISGTTATIDYVVENIGNSTIELDLRSSSDYSYIFDDQGNEYSIKSGNMILGTSTNSTGSVSKSIPAGVKVKGSFKIVNVANETSTFSNITIYSYGLQSTLVMKNVLIEGRSHKKPQEPQTTASVVSFSDNLEFTIVDCKRNSSNTVTISYRVKNMSTQAIELDLRTRDSRSLIFDDMGNEYAFGELTLGLSKNSTGSASVIIPEDVFVNGTIVVKNVDESATEFSNISIYSYGFLSTVYFKNVKIRN